MQEFDCAIVGAGLAGLAAARDLKRAGQSVVVLEKSRAVGGRLASRRAEIAGETVVFEHGAQNIKSRGRALDEAAREVLADGERIFIDAPVCLHDGANILAGDENSNAEPKWSCRGGITRFPKALARDLDVRFSTRIISLGQNARGFEVRGENGESFGARHVIVSAPAAQSADLLEASELVTPEEGRIAILRAATFHRCLSVMLFFPTPFAFDWYALLARDRTHPLLWLASENHKQEIGGAAFVAQLGPAWSEAHYEDSEEDILAATLGFIAPILGELGAPIWSNVKRWRYSQPRETVSFEEANPAGSSVIVCGDALAKGRAPDAYDSGLEAAQRVLEMN